MCEANQRKVWRWMSFCCFFFSSFDSKKYFFLSLVFALSLHMSAFILKQRDTYVEFHLEFVNLNGGWSLNLMFFFIFFFTQLHQTVWKFSVLFVLEN